MHPGAIYINKGSNLLPTGLGHYSHELYVQNLLDLLGRHNHLLEKCGRPHSAR